VTPSAIEAATSGENAMNKNVTVQPFPMQIDRDIAIGMDDGLVLRADISRPIQDGQYPVLISIEKNQISINN
jgi:uncharacterized protein